MVPNSGDALTHVFAIGIFMTKSHLAKLRWALHEPGHQNCYFFARVRPNSHKQDKGPYQTVPICPMPIQCSIIVAEPGVGPKFQSIWRGGPNCAQCLVLPFHINDFWDLVLVHVGVAREGPNSN